MNTSLQAAAEVVLREAALLDEHRWADWLALYAPDCEFWMPMWRTEEELNADPQTGLSHIYYSSRAGLEDRVARIRSRKSPASQPLPRTSHVLGASLAVDGGDGTLCLRTAWSCHVVFPRHRTAHAFFGWYRHELAETPEGWRIRRKYVALMNDYIPTMLDVYCV
ncbi:anthranilate 1,2-dioxygenase small subunit [Pigmentiphaga soli]|uniref:Anthranilate 1,2-dioxygenase small subunit n=1 Tax=Pigmentiphaga soli TaxID=1007095 RepID=A0ABP8HRR8_9BURK